MAGMVEHCCNWLDMTGMVRNGWKWLEMAENYQKQLAMAGIAGKGYDNDDHNDNDDDDDKESNRMTI